MKEFDLEPGEHVVMELRKHWFLFLLELLPYAIFAVLPFAAAKIILLSPMTAAYAPYFNFSSEMPRVLVSIWLLLTWTVAWGAFTRYFLNAWVLTNQRIVAIKQRRFFSHEVSSVLLPRVQDITTDVEGVLPSFLNIGSIKVESAGADVDLVMNGIPRPEQLRNIILKYVGAVPGNAGAGV